MPANLSYLVVATVTMNLPDAGTVFVSADWNVFVGPLLGMEAECYLSRAGEALAAGPRRYHRSTGVAFTGGFSITRAFFQLSGPVNYRLACRKTATGHAVNVLDPTISAIYVPRLY